MTARINLHSNYQSTTIQTGNAITKDEILTQITEIVDKFQNGAIDYKAFRSSMSALGVQTRGFGKVLQYRYNGKVYTVRQNSTPKIQVPTYTLSQLKDSYKFTEEIINKYFKNDEKSGNYVLNTSAGCKTIDDVEQIVSQQYQNNLVLANFLNDKNKKTNAASELSKTNDGNKISKDNYKGYVDEIKSVIGDDENIAKQKALSKLIEDFSQGNVAFSILGALFKAIGITDYKALVRSNLELGFEFKYENKTYRMYCKGPAMASGTDNKTVTTYNKEDLLKLGANEELINKYFVSATVIDGEDKTYSLKNGITYNEFIEIVEKNNAKNEEVDIKQDAIKDTNISSDKPNLYSINDLKNSYKLADSDISHFFNKKDAGYEINKNATKSCFGKEINTIEELLSAMQNEGASANYIFGAYSMGNDKYIQYFIVTGEGNNKKYTLNKEKIEKDFSGQQISTIGQLKDAVDAKNSTVSKNDSNKATETTTSNSANNTSTITTEYFTNGLLRGAKGLDESIVNECFYKVGKDSYSMNMNAIKHRFPNSNITTLDDFVSAYKNNKMVYTEGELKGRYFRNNPERIDFMFKKNEDGTYSIDTEKLKYGSITTRDIESLAKLTDYDIANQFYENSRKTHYSKEMTTGSEIKKYLEYYVELYKRGIKLPTNKCDAEMLNSALTSVFSNLEISEKESYNLSEITTKFDSLLSDYITGRNKHSVGVNGELDEATAQGGSQDCWLIAGVLALNNTSNGKQILKNSISVNQDGSVNVKFAGVNAEYKIPYDEMMLYDKKAFAYSVGDNDLLAIEIAVKKLKNDIDNGKVILNVAENSYEGDKSNSLDGGYAQQLLYFLTGNLSNTKAVNVPSNASENDVKEVLSRGLANSEIYNFLNSQTASNSALTFSMYYSDKSAKCTDGSTFSAKLGDNGHTYAITNVDTSKKTITFVDPSNSTKSYTMTWDEFAKMGIGMLSSTAINNSKVEVTPKSRNFDADAIIEQLYANSNSASNKSTSQNNFTVELFDVDSDLYKVSLALIKNIYAGATDLSKFRDVLLQMGADSNFTPDDFVKSLAEKLQSGEFESVVDKQNQTKDLYTSVVSGYLSSLGTDGVVNIGDFMQRLSAIGLSREEMTPVIDVFTTSLYSMMLSQNKDLSQEDFTTMLYSGSIKASDINNAIKKSSGTRTGVALNEALTKEVSDATSSVMSTNAATSIASSVYAADISNIMGLINGDKSWEGHVTIAGKDYDMSAYAWNKLKEESNSDPKAIYNILKETKSSSEYDVIASNGSTVSASLDRTNEQVNWVDNKGVTHTVKYEEKEDDETLNTTYTIYGEKATVVIEETDEGFTISVKSKYGKKHVTKVGDNLDVKQLICGYAVNAKYSGRDDDGYDANGYDKDGYDANGYNKDGYDERGFNEEGINKKTGTIYDENGFDENGINKDTNTEFNIDGYDQDGYDKDGYDKNGYDERGFNSNDIHKNGTKYDNDGYDVSGKDKDGYYSNGYNYDGYDKFGYNISGYDKNGYNKEGYDKDGLNKFGFDKDGCDIDGDKLTQEELFEMVQNYLFEHYEGEFSKNLVLDTTNLPQLPNLSTDTPAEIQKSKNTIKTWINGVGSALGSAGKVVVGFLNDLYDGIKNCGAKVIGLFADIGKAIAKGVSSLVNCIKNIFKSSNKKSSTTTSNTQNKPVVSVFDSNNNKGNDNVATNNSNVTSVKPVYTKYDGKDVQTGEVVTYKDGRKFYYDVDSETGKKTLAGIQGADGVTIYLTPEGKEYAVRDAFGKYISYSEYEKNNQITSTDYAKMNDSINNLQWSSLISALNAAGNTELAKALEEWIEKGSQGSFSWRASSSSGSLNGNSGVGNSGITNGGYCPDGTWSPVAGSGWGSVMDGVIGVGGHGGGPILGGGGGASTNNSYH